ncbi:MAG: ECF transporter S component [Patescibacteria group bacterium]
MNEQTNILERAIIKVTVLKQIMFIVIFTALSVALPWFCHQFNLAGPIFLPMHFFVLMAGLLFGWRVGLITGLLTPLASYAFSGMPIVAILPVIILEVMAYGFFAGWLREKKMDLWLTLILALVFGKTVLFFSAWIFMPVNPANYLFTAVKTGLPGILIQLALLPFLVKTVQKYFAK